MAMMPGLQINIGQQLKLTPQLQQSIKILQYSALEVQQTIEATLETNFMLEIEDELAEEELHSSREDDGETPEFDADDSLKAIDINDDLDHTEDAYNADYSWDELHSDRLNSPSSNQQSDDDYTAAENYTAAHKSLHDHLNWQANV